MKIKVGDRVKFLNDTGGGTVSEIVDERTVNVRIEDGFDMPVLVSELIIDSDENKLIEKADKYKERSEQPYNIDAGIAQIKEDKILAENLQEKALKSVYFGMVPVNSKTIYKSDISTYLINDCDFYIYYLIGCMDTGSFRYIKSGMLEANTKEQIKTFSQTELSKIKKFHFQILFVNKGKYFPRNPVDKYFDIAKISFYKENNYSDNDFFYEKAYIFQIVDDNTGDDIKQKADSEIVKVLADKQGGINNKEKVRSEHKSDIEEVNLHIHEIVEDYSGLSEGEILKIQLKKFYDALEKAINANIKKIVFIHGLGNGKLKYEIRKAIDTGYPDLTYQDASFKEYGFGATLIKLL
jgi:hypothetical protein